jgi:hypothetical protein
VTSPTPPSGKARPGRGLRLVLGILWLGALAAITLTAGRAPRFGAPVIPSLCLFCGDRGAADAVLNVVLFLPLGLVLGPRRGLGFSLLAGFLVSGAIETAQLSLPGRNPALGDLVWNTTGAGIGAFVSMALHRWLAGPVPARARAVAVGLPVLYLLLAGWMAVPRGTDARYFGQWTPNLGHMAQYRGALLSAEIDGEPVPRGAYPADRVRPAIEDGVRLEVMVTKGPPTRSISPILSIYDEHQHEILLLGAQREDLVWRLRDRGNALTFDFREVRVPDALAAVSVGETMRLEAERREGSLCLSVDDGQRCGLGFAPSGTWRYLMNLEGASPAFRAALNVGWMVTLYFLVGLLGGALTSTLLMGAFSLGAAALVVAATPLVAGGWLGWTGLVLGIALGALMRPVMRALVGIRTSGAA